MRDPESVARAGYAAARLEQAWERWRALHGLGGSSDPLASYVGYSHKEPMGQPRVVIGMDAAEAEFFADFLESHDCGAPGRDPAPSPDAAGGVTRPSDGGGLYPPVSGLKPTMTNGSAPAPRHVSPDSMVRLVDGTDRPAAGPQVASAPITRSFPGPQPTFMPIAEAAPSGSHGSDERGGLVAPMETTGSAGLAGEAGHAEPLGPLDLPPGSPPDAFAAEMAGWASGELPGQASEQLAGWAGADAPRGRALNRFRSAR